MPAHHAATRTHASNLNAAEVRRALAKRTAMRTLDDALLPPLQGPQRPAGLLCGLRTTDPVASIQRGGLTEEQVAQTLDRLEPEQEPAAPPCIR